MAKTTATIERALFALNPIRYRLQLNMDDWPPFSDAGNRISVQGMDDVLIRYIADAQGKLDVDVSPVVRSLLAGILSRRKVPDELFSDYANCLRWCIENADNGTAYVSSVFGAYGRPYKDEDFTWTKGVFLNARRLTMYRGLPFSMQAVDMKYGQGVSVIAKDGTETSFFPADYVYGTEDVAETKSFTLSGTVYEKAFDLVPFRCFGDVGGGTKWNPCPIRIVFDYENTGSASTVLLTGDSSKLPINDRNGVVSFAFPVGAGHIDKTYYLDYLTLEDSIGFDKNRSGTLKITNFQVFVYSDPVGFRDVSLQKGTWTDTGKQRKRIYSGYKAGTELIISFDCKATGAPLELGNIEIELAGKGTCRRAWVKRNGMSHRFYVHLPGTYVWEGQEDAVYDINMYYGSGQGTAEFSNCRVYDISQEVVSGSHVAECNPNKAGLQPGLYKVKRTDFVNVMGTVTLEAFPVFGELEVRDYCPSSLLDGKQVYVRFLNRWGGWSYYLLDVVDDKEDGKVEYALRQRLSLQPVNGAVEGDRVALGCETQRSITAGKDGFTPQEMEDLSYITSSPMVDVWDEENQCFTPVYPKSGKTSWNFEERQEFTVEIEMPTGGY